MGHWSMVNTTGYKEMSPSAYRRRGSSHRRLCLSLPSFFRGAEGFLAISFRELTKTSLSQSQEPFSLNPPGIRRVFWYTHLVHLRSKVATSPAVRKVFIKPPYESHFLTTFFKHRKFLLSDYQNLLLFSSHFICLYYKSFLTNCVSLLQ